MKNMYKGDATYITGDANTLQYGMKNDNKLKVNTYDISMVVDSGYNIPVVTFYSISLW
jgi:transposase